MKARVFSEVVGTPRVVLDAGHPEDLTPAEARALAKALCAHADLCEVASFWKGPDRTGSDLNVDSYISYLSAHPEPDAKPSGATPAQSEAPDGPVVQSQDRR